MSFFKNFKQVEKSPINGGWVGSTRIDSHSTSPIQIEDKPGELRTFTRNTSTNKILLTAPLVKKQLFSNRSGTLRTNQTASLRKRPNFLNPVQSSA